MKLAKALKEKKRLAAEIAHLKNIIQKKNSYIKGSTVAEKFNVSELHKELMSKIETLLTLKIVINEANKEIQPDIYRLSEYKSLIAFFNSLDVREGVHESYSDNLIDYQVQLDEVKRDELVKTYQAKADLIQDQIDTYNFTTEVVWNELPPEEDKTEEEPK